MYLIYNRSGQMIGHGYSEASVAYRAASGASRRQPTDTYSVYVLGGGFNFLDRQYKAGSIVPMALGAKA